DQNLLVRILVQDLTRGVQAVHVGHSYVENDDIRVHLLHHFHSLPSVASLPTDFPAAGLQQVTQTSADYFVIVSDQNANIAHKTPGMILLGSKALSPKRDLRSSRVCV